MAQEKIDGTQVDLTNADGSVLTGIDAVNVSTGVFADARVSQSSVTQHEAALSIGGSQVTSAVANATDATQLGGVAAASYALLANPAFTGNPTAPTQTAGNNTTRIATTAFVQNAVATGGSSVVQSPQLAYSGSLTTTTWNHGQGAVPKMVEVQLINVIAEGGYSPGNILSLGNALSETDSGGGPQNDGISAQVSSTQVIVRVGNRRAIALTTGLAHFNPNAANWNMLISIIT